MLLQVKHRCPDPKCGNLVDFSVSQVGEITKKEPDPRDPAKWRVVPKNVQMPPENLDGLEACGMSRCPICGEPLLIVFRTTRQLLQQAFQAEQQARNNHQTMHGVRLMGDSIVVLRTYPESRQPIAHPTWPEEIREPFVDAQKMLSENKTPSFIIGGCRAVLDVATKKLDEKSPNLAGRIKELAAQGIITGGLKDWADKLRLDGNTALHELKGDREDAVQLVEFIKVFLHVAFELPAAIREKSPAEPAGTKDSSESEK